MSVIFGAVCGLIWIVVIIGIVVILRKHNTRLFKSSVDKKLCGVCGGLAEAFGIDSTIVRILWVIFTICGGSGILAYILAAIVMPKDVNVVG